MAQDRRTIIAAAGAVATGLGLPSETPARAAPASGEGGGKVLGLGGVFLKVADEKAWRAWYADALGVKFTNFGSAVFQHPKTGVTQLAPFAADTTYFKPSTAPFMINLIVEDIDALIARAAAHRAPCLGRQDDPSFGRFAWLLDPAGIKVELWEPKGESTPAS
jgi:predicted enzyme related to lactoylglutathione lyase